MNSGSRSGIRERGSLIEPETGSAHSRHAEKRHHSDELEQPRENPAEQSARHELEQPLQPPRTYALPVHAAPWRGVRVVVDVYATKVQ